MRDQDVEAIHAAMNTIIEGLARLARVCDAIQMDLGTIVDFLVPEDDDEPHGSPEGDHAPKEAA